MEINVANTKFPNRPVLRHAMTAKCLKQKEAFAAREIACPVRNMNTNMMHILAQIATSMEMTHLTGCPIQTKGDVSLQRIRY